LIILSSLSLWRISYSPNDAQLQKILFFGYVVAGILICGVVGYELVKIIKKPKQPKSIHFKEKN
jgi:hypothetical protein